MARVLFATVELLVVKAIGETMVEADEHGEAAAFVLALPRVVCPSRVLPMVTRGSSSG